jgi:hypothetical protein
MSSRAVAERLPGEPTTAPLIPSKSLVAARAYAAGGDGAARMQMRRRSNTTFGRGHTVT